MLAAHLHRLARTHRPAAPRVRYAADPTTMQAIGNFLRLHEMARGMRRYLHRGVQQLPPELAHLEELMLTGHHAVFGAQGSFDPTDIAMLHDQLAEQTGFAQNANAPLELGTYIDFLHNLVGDAANRDPQRRGALPPQAHAAYAQLLGAQSPRLMRANRYEIGDLLEAARALHGTLADMTRHGTIPTPHLFHMLHAAMGSGRPLDIDMSNILGMAHAAEEARNTVGRQWPGLHAEATDVADIASGIGWRSHDLLTGR